MLKFPAVLGLLLTAFSISAEEGQDLQIPAGKHGEYSAYLPAGATPEKPCSLVVAWHGHGGDAVNFLRCLKPAADAGGFAILSPEGVEKVDKGF